MSKYINILGPASLSIIAAVWVVIGNLKQNKEIIQIKTVQEEFKIQNRDTKFSII